MTSDKLQSLDKNQRLDRLHKGPEVTWIFDLDNTLYDANTDVFKQIDVRMGGFISNLLKLDAVEARKVQKDYLRDYGTTLKGLMENHAIDPRDFLDYVHDVDLSSVAYDEKLAAAISGLEGRKLVFTNGDVPHADRVLSRLGIEDEIEGVYDIALANYSPKPNKDAYEGFLRHFDVNPETAVMVEDMARNLIPAYELGMTTVWVNANCQWGKMDHSPDHIDVEIPTLSAWLHQLVHG